MDNLFKIIFYLLCAVVFVVLAFMIFMGFIGIFAVLFGVVAPCLIPFALVAAIVWIVWFYKKGPGS